MSDQVYYTVVAFNGQLVPRKYRGVREKDLPALATWLKREWPGVRYMNVYLKATREYLKRVYID